MQDIPTYMGVAMVWHIPGCKHECSRRACYPRHPIMSLSGLTPILAIWGGSWGSGVYMEAIRWSSGILVLWSLTGLSTIMGIWRIWRTSVLLRIPWVTLSCLQGRSHGISIPLYGDTEYGGMGASREPSHDIPHMVYIRATPLTPIMGSGSIWGPSYTPKGPTHPDHHPMGVYQAHALNSPLWVYGGYGDNHHYLRIPWVTLSCLQGRSHGISIPLYGDTGGGHPEGHPRHPEGLHPEGQDLGSQDLGVSIWGGSS